MDPELAREAYGLGSKVSRERIERAQKDVKNPSWDKIVPILYRPFDVRYTYYTGTANGFHERPRPEVMRHMLAGKGENVALVTMRQVSLHEAYTHALVTTHIVDNRAFVSSKGITLVVPLYLCPDTGSRDLLSGLEPQERRPNLKPSLLDDLGRAYGETPPPEQVFHYIYAVLYAPSYRDKYADFLRLDFPRIPFPADAGVHPEGRPGPAGGLRPRPPDGRPV
jgi:predicted helicase